MTLNHGRLLFLALGWGATFPLTRLGLNDLGPLWFVFLRFSLGALLLLIHQRGRIPDLRATFRQGIVLGLLLGSGYVLQTLGLVYTESGRAGFITGLYLILVPLLGWCIFRQSISRVHLVGAVISLTGMLLLSWTGPFSFAVGDVLVFGAAMGFGLQILWVSRVIPSGNPLGFAFHQSWVTAAVAGILALFFESPTFNFGAQGWAMVVLCTVLATYPALLFQLQAQVEIHPSEAALLMALEAPFAALFGWALIGETMGGVEAFGAALMFFGVTLTPMTRVWNLRGRRRRLPPLA